MSQPSYFSSANGQPGSGFSPFPPQNTSPLSPPPADPNDPGILQSSTGLESQLSADDITNNQVAAQDDALTTANSVRQSIYGTLDGISQQAISAAEAQIGEEIQQSKKAVDNAGKAV